MTNSILRHIEAILETGSVQAASRKLYLSQPALSQYVKRLEAEYEIEIFNRTVSPWTLTEEGACLLDAQRRIDAIDRQCRQFFSDRKGLKSGEIRIGSTAYRTATLLNPILTAFNREHPNVMIKIAEGTTQETAYLAESGQVDCSIVISSMVPPTLESIPVYRERVLLGLPPSHPYAAEVREKTGFDGYPRADFARLDGMPFITMKAGQVFHDYFEKLCELHCVSMPVAMETQSILTVPALIMTGMGGALIPDTIAAECKRCGVPLFSLGDDLPVNEVSLAWKRGGYRSYAARAFIQAALRALSGSAESEVLSKKTDSL